MSPRAVITGGLGEIGRALCERFLARGHEVHLVDLRDDTEAAAAALGAIGHRVDITDPGDVRRLEAIGGVDQLVNGAGIWPPCAFEDMTIEHWRPVVEVSLTGTFLVTRALLAGLRERRGSVVNITSAIAFKGNPGMAAYAAAKAGVIGLTRALARELGPDGVRVNALAPGLVETEHNRALWTHEHLDRAAADRSLPGRLDAAGVADAIMLLTGQDAREITGQTLLADGGIVLR
jgi:3-oxoacyl-[acyl-carrier protein] reductase